MSQRSGEFSPVPSRDVEALAIRTRLYEAGGPDRPTLLLLHGMTSSGDSFRELMHAMSAHARLVAVDIPGFGYSDHTSPYTISHLIEWLAALMDTLALPPVILVGHSFGGLLAASFALAYPEDVRGMLLLAPALLAGNEFPDWALAIGATLDYLGVMEFGVAVSQSQLLVERQMRVAYHDPDKQPPSLWERRAGDYERARATADVIKAVAAVDLTVQLSSLPEPLWIIWGRQDPVLDAEHADRLSALLPQAQIFVVPDCGHVPMVEQLDRVVDIFNAFLAENAT